MNAIIWFSGHAANVSGEKNTCAVPSYTKASGMSSNGLCCGSNYANNYWNNVFEFYSTDVLFKSDNGTTCDKRLSDLTLNHIYSPSQITGDITLTFWRPRYPNGTDTTWTRGVQDGGAWSVPTATGNTSSYATGTVGTVTMVEYKTTLSQAQAQALFKPVTSPTPGITLDLSATGTGRFDFVSKCYSFSRSSYSETYMINYNKLGRYVLTVPTNRRTFTKDTGFYSS